MKIICDRDILNEAVAKAALAAQTKATPAVLEGVLLSAENNKLKLTGYNLDLGISTSINAKVGEEGSVVLKASLLSEVLGKMPRGEISVSSDERRLTVIQDGAVEFSFVGLDAQEYPQLPETENNRSFEIESEIFKSMLSQTLFAAAQTEQQQILYTGALFNIEGGVLDVVALDGYRLAMRREKTILGL